MNIKFDSDIILSINLFSDVTSVMPRDCINFEDKIVFVVNQGQAGLAIGKNGIKIKMLQEMLKKEVIVIEYSDDPVKLFENVIRPNKLISGYITVNGKEDESKKVEASVDGKISSNKIKLIKMLMQRYFNIVSINIK
ncbi:MAG: NusA-like transcription termination signal-binding factor [Candidatus Parvarchaeota archaeon]|nr:NusA-like transcription termination signal-binding factor [Candidatus Parvarchaeota archaeon]MCW1294410.1 NusA-like transcription termination signal-binding factor [Candidatus Parvarchaeum tengchongense]MCW1295137.1 NusA-like transcription termination signal-binding factor [Candidatus Parvarchaeum tengchongense]MCW1299622.1 NusA-like transcription termination signal-binding factor [Candidatus Parvarchaeum tengchongense]MCW1312444.1 NusA-like transcription termination signal-binding factor [C